MSMALRLGPDTLRFKYYQIMFINYEVIWQTGLLIDIHEALMIYDSDKNLKLGVYVSSFSGKRILLAYVFHAFTHFAFIQTL